ncbi:MAG: 3-oxo-tetronate kinase [Acidobacteriota bacterium]
MPTILGCIADDMTGASDLATSLAQNGMSTLMMPGLPTSRPLTPASALVVALKTRTIAASEACEQAVAAAEWLLEQGARHLYFKYCSTFDSTDAGNIGPVIEALMRQLGSEITLACPAFPALRRTVYQGHLFVGDRLLSESSLKDHPLTPMRDADLVRVLQRQLAVQRAGLLELTTVENGSEAIQARLDSLRRDSRRVVIVDAIFERHLQEVAEAAHQLPLLTGGSALAACLPERYRQIGALAEARDSAELPSIDGPVAILSGSCSAATREQVADFAAELPIVAVDPIALDAGASSADSLFDSAHDLWSAGAVAFASSASPNAVEAAQRQLGRKRAAERIEQTFADLAVRLVAHGVRKLIVAGGETSGAVLEALGLRQLLIGPAIEPGVPWCAHPSEPQLLVALKSGNFGSRQFFTRAIEALP